MPSISWTTISGFGMFRIHFRWFWNAASKVHGWGRPLQKRLDPQNGASPSFKETQILHWIGRCRADECFRISKVSISLQPVMLVYWRGILRKSLAAMVYCVIPIMSRRPSVDLDRWPGDAEVHFFCSLWSIWFQFANFSRRADCGTAVGFTPMEEVPV